MIDIVTYRCRIGGFVQRLNKTTRHGKTDSNVSKLYFLFFVVSYSIYTKTTYII